MIQLTPAAIREMTRLQSRQPNAATGSIRLGVAPGGCATVYYTLTFRASATDDDQVILVDSLQLIVASGHQPYLTGVIIDYAEDLMGGGFRFHNPQATSTCGCGNSFSIESLEPSHADAAI